MIRVAVVVISAVAMTSAASPRPANSGRDTNGIADRVRRWIDDARPRCATPENTSFVALVTNWAVVCVAVSVLVAIVCFGRANGHGDANKALLYRFTGVTHVCIALGTSLGLGYARTRWSHLPGLQKHVSVSIGSPKAADRDFPRSPPSSPVAETTNRTGVKVCGHCETPFPVQHPVGHRFKCGKCGLSSRKPPTKDFGDFGFGCAQSAPASSMDATSAGLISEPKDSPDRVATLERKATLKAEKETRKQRLREEQRALEASEDEERRELQRLVEQARAAKIEKAELEEVRRADEEEAARVAEAETAAEAETVAEAERAAEAERTAAKPPTAVLFATTIKDKLSSLKMIPTPRCASAPPTGGVGQPVYGTIHPVAGQPGYVPPKMVVPPTGAVKTKLNAGSSFPAPRPLPAPKRLETLRVPGGLAVKSPAASTAVGDTTNSNFPDSGSTARATSPNARGTSIRTRANALEVDFDPPLPPMAPMGHVVSAWHSSSGSGSSPLGLASGSTVNGIRNGGASVPNKAGGTPTDANATKNAFHAMGGNPASGWLGAGARFANLLAEPVVGLGTAVSAPVEVPRSVTIAPRDSNTQPDLHDGTGFLGTRPSVVEQTIQRPPPPPPSRPPPPLPSGPPPAHARFAGRRCANNSHSPPPLPPTPHPGAGARGPLGWSGGGGGGTVAVVAGGAFGGGIFDFGFSSESARRDAPERVSTSPSRHGHVRRFGSFDSDLFHAEGRELEDELMALTGGLMHLDDDDDDDAATPFALPAETEAPLPKPDESWAVPSFAETSLFAAQVDTQVHTNGRGQQSTQVAPDDVTDHSPQTEPQPSPMMQASVMKIRVAHANAGVSGEPIPAEFFCSITRDVMVDPVIAWDGYTYERVSISRWLDKHSTSPMTGAPMPDFTLRPNHSMRSQMIGFGERL